MLGFCRQCQWREQFKQLPDDQKERYILSVIPKRYLAAKISDLPAAAQKILSEAKPEQGIYVWGPAGVGKTHTLAALGISSLRDGFDVKRITYDMLCLQLRSSYKPNSNQTELDIIKPLVEADMLILEDVGTTVSVGNQESDFSLRTFLIILNERYEKCLPTFISGNKSVEEIEKSFDSRIASRLRSGLILPVTGKDKRRK